MKEGQPQAVYLKDYTPPNFLIDHVYLAFDLDHDVTNVTSEMLIRRNPECSHEATTIELHGEELKLINIDLDDERLSPDQYIQSDETLLISNVPKQFSLKIQVQITPQTNTSLEGLYKSMTEVAERYCEQLAEKIKDNEVVELTAEMMSVTADIVLKALFSAENPAAISEMYRIMVHSQEYVGSSGTKGA